MWKSLPTVSTISPPSLLIQPCEHLVWYLFSKMSLNPSEVCKKPQKVSPEDDSLSLTSAETRRDNWYSYSGE